MRRIIATVLSLVLLVSGCGTKQDSSSSVATSTSPLDASAEATSSLSSPIAEGDTKTVLPSDTPYMPEEVVSFDDLNDPKLLQYVQDGIYSNLEDSLGSEDYEIENISTTFISKEYLDEMEFNSRKNIYFGYTLDELEEQFQGKKYVFTLGSNGQTVVEVLNEYDDTFEQVVKNVAVGAGVILICVTVSALTAGAGAPVVSMVFAASAQTGTTIALSSAAMGGISAGIVTALQTKDPEQALKSAALNASEGFKWGAILGAASGGLSEAVSLYSSDIPTARESELRALKKYGGDEQKAFKNGEEVARNTIDSTRPDIVREVGGKHEAIEVKNCDLESRNSVAELYDVLRKEMSARISNLPEGYTQRVVLDIKGRGYSNELVQAVIDGIQVTLEDIYPNIPVSVIG